MFGLMKYDRVEWNEVEYSKISLFGFVKNEWRDMEHEEFIPFYTIPLHSIIFFKSKQ
jgi:hypothetical protein